MKKDEPALNSHEIWCSVGVTKNLGNYESLRIDAGARINVTDVVSSEDWTKLWELVSQQIDEQLSPSGDGD